MEVEKKLLGRGGWGFQRWVRKSRVSGKACLGFCPIPGGGYAFLSLSMLKRRRRTYLYEWGELRDGDTKDKWIIIPSATLAISWPGDWQAQLGNLLREEIKVCNVLIAEQISIMSLHRVRGKTQNPLFWPRRSIFSLMDLSKPLITLPFLWYFKS